MLAFRITAGQVHNLHRCARRNARWHPEVNLMGDLTRRQVLTRGGVAVAGIGGLSGAGVAGYAWPHAAASTGKPDGSLGVQHFTGRPDLQPPTVTISHSSPGAGLATDPPYIFVTAKGYPATGPGQPGLMIADRRGGLVWFSPS